MYITTYIPVHIIHVHVAESIVVFIKGIGIMPPPPSYKIHARLFSDFPQGLGGGGGNDWQSIPLA